MIKMVEDKEKIEEKIFSSRKLYSGEYEILIRYLSSVCEKVIISVDRLEDWVYSNSFIRQLVELNKDIKVLIEYEQSTDIEKSQKQISYNYKEPIDYVEKGNGYYISWNFDNQYRVYGIPKHKKVISETTSVVNVEYYIENLASE